MPFHLQPKDIGLDPDDYLPGQVPVMQSSGLFAPGWRDDVLTGRTSFVNLAASLPLPTVAAEVGTSVPATVDVAASMPLPTVAAEVGDTAAWTPASLGAKLRGWYEPRLGVSVDGSDNIDSFTDHSDNGFHLTQTSADLRASLVASVVNDHPVARFSPYGPHYYTVPDDLLSSVSAGIETAIALKIVNDPPGSQGFSGLWRIGAGDGLSTHYPFTDSNVYDQFGTLARKSTGNPTDPLNVWHTYQVTSQPSLWTSWVNGSEHFTTTDNTVNTTSGGLFGSSATGGGGVAYLDGDVAAWVVTDPLTTQERTDLRTYLETVFGL